MFSGFGGELPELITLWVFEGIIVGGAIFAAIYLVLGFCLQLMHR